MDHSIYEVPLMLQRERLDDLVCRLLHLDTPAAEHDALAGNHPQTHRAAASRPHRRRRQIHRAAGRLQIGLRGDHPRRHRQRLRRGNREGGLRGNREATARKRCSKGLGGILVPGGFGERGIEGKIKAAQYRPRKQSALSRPLPRHADRHDRIRPQRAQAGEGALDRVRSRHAASGHRPAGRAEAK